MFTESVPEPALQVLTTNSEGTPVRTEEKENISRLLEAEECVRVCNTHTCGSSLQASAVRCHHARVSDQTGVSHPHVKGAPGNVAPIELDVNGMHAVLPGNEADGVPV